MAELNATISSGNETLTKQLEDNHDMRWNICTEAEEKVCYTSGSLVFFAMVPGEQ